MKNIYAVESGSGEDFETHAMFELREDAEAWIQNFGRPEWQAFEVVVEHVLFEAGEAALAEVRTVFQACWNSSEDAPRLSPPFAHEMMAFATGPRHGVHEDRIIVFACGETKADALKACLEYGHRLAAELRELS